MAETNRKSMQIPHEVLAEKNYEGSRLIEITDEKVVELNVALKALQAEANPHLEIMESITPQLDPLYTKLRELEQEKAKVRETMEPIKAPYDIELQAVEKIDQKAQLINSIVAPMLGEFEKAQQMKEIDGKLFVEVVDEIEEKVKAIRAAKAKK